jgi:hypothetical protein
MKNKINNGLLILKRHGIAITTMHLVHRIIHKLHGGIQKYQKIYLYILDTPKPNTKSIEAAKHHTFKFATKEELISLQKNLENDISDSDMEAFDNGARCLLQLDGEELVGYAWIASSNEITISWGFLFKMSDETVYNYNGYTSPKYRGKGFQPLRHLKLLELTKTEGKKQLIGYVNQLNLSSQKGVRKSGYYKVGALKCTRDENTVNFSLTVERKFWGGRIK